MTPELTTLALAGLLQAAQFALFAIPANRELGVGYTYYPLDRPPSRQLSQTTARLQRALNNPFEALNLFTLAVVMVIRRVLCLVLSCDHRIGDGKGAVTFLVRGKEAQEDPRRLLMDS